MIIFTFGNPQIIAQSLILCLAMIPVFEGTAITVWSMIPFLSTSFLHSFNIKAIFISSESSNVSLYKVSEKDETFDGFEIIDESIFDSSFVFHDCKPIFISFICDENVVGK